MFAVFPIVMCCSAAILHLRLGGIAAASMFAHAQIALSGLWLGFLAMHTLVAPVGVWAAFVLGLAVCIAWSGLLWIIRARKITNSSSPVAP
jgi:putative Ca2+/H+ antiporter (TMEM165/GDT1 family)